MGGEGGRRRFSPAPNVPPPFTLAAPPRYFNDIGIWDQGRMDGWNSARDPGFGMAYFNRTDLPFYYALAGACVWVCGCLRAVDVWVCGWAQVGGWVRLLL